MFNRDTSQPTKHTRSIRTRKHHAATSTLPSIWSERVSCHQTQWGTAALHGQITLKNGRVEQSNFHDYEMLRINELPAIEVHIVRNSEPPGGMGECGTSAIVPAVSNAIFAATGKRLRKMPIDAALLKQPV